MKIISPEGPEVQGEAICHKAENVNSIGVEAARGGQDPVVVEIIPLSINRGQAIRKVPSAPLARLSSLALTTSSRVAHASPQSGPQGPRA
jgi:hypothetical protein